MSDPIHYVPKQHGKHLHKTACSIPVIEVSNAANKLEQATCKACHQALRKKHATKK